MGVNIELTPGDKKQLRGKAQRIEAAVSIGKQGLTDTILKEINTALSRDDLVKVRFNVSREPMLELCQVIEEQAQCTRVGNVGKTASFYRPNLEETEE